jgi:hypothetical protein
MMTHSPALPQLGSKGVAFRLNVNAREQDCLVSKEALDMLSGLRDTNPDPLEVFYAFQPAITALASRLIRQGVKDRPLVLGPDLLVDAGVGRI